MGVAQDNKTVELRGGPLNGKRTSLPAGNTQLTLPVNSADPFSAWAVYRPSADRCADGIEIWDEYIESQWGDTDLTNL